jgi:hypothetical protein
VEAEHPARSPAMRPATPRVAILRRPRFLLGRFLGEASFAAMGGAPAELQLAGRVGDWGMRRNPTFGGDFGESLENTGASDKLTVSHSHVRIGAIQGSVGRIKRV